jgi:alpha-tubulin suppressor-like RCC1 family protein
MADAGDPPGQEVLPGPAPPAPSRRDDESDYFWGGKGGGLIAAGVKHSLVLNLYDNGSVSVFGSSAHGQLGLSHFRAERRPVKIPGITKAICVAAGDHHSAIVLRSGQVLTFGANESGQLGHNNFERLSTPKAVEGINTAWWVACGWNFTIVILIDGTAVAFGDNTFGQLGIVERGAGVRIPTPHPVPNLPFPVVAVSAGSYSAVYLSRDGRVATTGNSLFRQCPPRIVEGLQDVIAIEAGPPQYIVLQRNGKISKVYSDQRVEEIRGGEAAPRRGIAIAWSEGSDLFQPFTIHMIEKETHRAYAMRDRGFGENWTLIPGIENALLITAGRNHTLVMVEGGKVMFSGYLYVGPDERRLIENFIDINDL